MKRPLYLVPITCLVAIAAVRLLQGQSSSVATMAKANAGVDSASTNYTGTAQTGRVGVNDTVTITVLNDPEISKAWRISSSGDLSLPEAGRIHAEGMTVEQLEQELSTRLTKYYRDPQVTVFISETLSHPVTISGDVMKPGKIQLTAPTTLLEAVVEAGGVKESATMVTVTRPAAGEPMNSPLAHIDEDGKLQVLAAPVKAIMAGDGEGGRFMVLPGDVVSVSSEKRPTRMVYIMGEVNKAGAIELVEHDSVPLTKVITLAGGFTKIAKPNNAIFKHINENNVTTAVSKVNAEKIVTGKAQDLLLSDGDEIVIPSNQLMNYFQLATQSAITTGILILGRF